MGTELVNTVIEGDGGAKNWLLKVIPKHWSLALISI